MSSLLRMKYIAWLIIFLTIEMAHAQVRTMDDFETRDGWAFNKSDGVNVSLSVDEGISGLALRFDYDFTKGTGYGGIQKFFAIDLPENFEFTFYLKADSPSNNFEIKFIDSTGNNVWWVNNRNYDFPQEWKKIRIKKRHINFAWGPIEDHSMHRIDRVEFTIASYVGGKGTIWLDGLQFEPLPAETSSYPVPAIEATSSLKNHYPEMMLDNSAASYWQTNGVKDQQLFIDFKSRWEFGGLQIDWLKGHHAISFDVLLSEDGKSWEKAYSVASNLGDASFVRLPEAEAKYLKIILYECFSKEGFAISELKFLDIRSSLSPNDFLIYTAKNSPTGYFPRYFLEQATYWTITGVNNDVKEALINEYGMVEVDKGLFSIEPMIRIGDSLFNWSNVNSKQSLAFHDDARDFGFVPTVSWQFDEFIFKVGVVSSGEANTNSVLDILYSFENLSDKPIDFEFYLLIRPFQVNPYYQWLNITGGAGKIYSIKQEDSDYPQKVISVDQKSVISHIRFDDFGVGAFDNGNLVGLLQEGVFPAADSAFDTSGMANGIIKYSFNLESKGYNDLLVTVPFYEKEDYIDELYSAGIRRNGFYEAREFWESKTDHIKFNLPPSADRIINTYKANLVYILINRDKAGIQPGSRSYERSWIRDGALTSSALLKSGIVPEVKDFIQWYSDNLFDDGKVPCVVDFRGPDPVPENDSHGEFIYLIREYFNFTKDTVFLRDQNMNILKVIGYIESLIAHRSKDTYKNDENLRAYYGLVPESISHEGYSAKPMHSYWDDFFIMKGLKDAAEIQKILGETENYTRIAAIRDTFRGNLYHSLDLAMKAHNIDYVPGCVELGDFDATSTTIALTPCNELGNLPKPQVYNTFDKYYQFFRNRRDGKLGWVNYTPYENRLIGSFILLDQSEKAHELIGFFLNDQRPQGWYHWAEVVWHDDRHPGYIGDMPHTWCGSDFLNAVRSMFVYENEYDQSLVLAAALYQDWIDAPGGISVENLPTYYGEVSYSVMKNAGSYTFKIYGDVKPPVNGIKIKNFNGSKPPSKVTVNGNATDDYNGKEIIVKEFPAEVVIYY